VVVRWFRSTSYSMLGPVSAWMGDRLRAGKPPRYVASQPHQFSLVIPLWVGAISTSLDWEGNCRSNVALAMRQTQTIVVYPPTGSTVYVTEMSTPPTLLLGDGSGTPLPFLPITCISPASLLRIHLKHQWRI